MLWISIRWSQTFRRPDWITDSYIFIKDFYRQRRLSYVYSSLQTTTTWYWRHNYCVKSFCCFISLLLRLKWKYFLFWANSNDGFFQWCYYDGAFTSLNKIKFEYKKWLLTRLRNGNFYRNFIGCLFSTRTTFEIS